MNWKKVITGLLLLSAGYMAQAQHRIYEPIFEEEEYETLLRKGDYITYRYYGSYRPDTITLTEEVMAQDSNQLIIRVTLRLADTTKIWLQFITDTEENRENNVVDSLFIWQNGHPVKLENKNNRDLYELYEGTYINPTHMRLKSKLETVIPVLGRMYPCFRELYLARWKGKEVIYWNTEAPQFEWRNMKVEVQTFPPDKELIYMMEIVDFGKRVE